MAELTGEAACRPGQLWLGGQADSGNGIAFVVYDINNLPVTEYKRDGTVIQYTYDANACPPSFWRGQRATKLVGSAYTWYIPGSDGKSEILYNNSTGNPTYNVWALDNVGQVKRSGTTLTRYYYVKDHLGDIRVTVTSSGTVDSYFDYYPFGQLYDGRNQVGSSDSRYRFVGDEHDPESAYEWLGARSYDARIARFLSVDPLVIRMANWTPYAYCYNDPISYADPTGLQGELEVHKTRKGAFYTDPVVVLGYGSKGDGHIGSTAGNGVRVSYSKTQDGTYSDLPVNPRLIVALNASLIWQPSVTSINISATTNGVHSSMKSAHYAQRALDISEVNGVHAGKMSFDEAYQFQMAYEQSPDRSENFGPAFCNKNGVPLDPKKEGNAGIIRDHKNHFHFSVISR